MRKTLRKPRQRDFVFPSWGGRRKGAGRKAAGDREGVEHTRRPALTIHTPAHVTIRVEKGIPSLRSFAAMRIVRHALWASKERLGVRIVQFTIQSNHIHLILEAESRLALARAMKGLCVRMARGLNRVLGRKGRVFADRYHVHVLRSPREVRNAIDYVANNSRIHAVRSGRQPDETAYDPFAAGPQSPFFPDRNRDLVVEPHSWLLRTAWGLPPRREEPRPGASQALRAA